VQLEVRFPLGCIVGSGCKFQRNGSRYSSPAVQEHLPAKYDYLAAKDLVQTADQFIDKAAAESSLSGQR
jgi:hypothetical protein